MKINASVISIYFDLLQNVGHINISAKVDKNHHKVIEIFNKEEKGNDIITLEDKQGLKIMKSEYNGKEEKKYAIFKNRNKVIFTMEPRASKWGSLLLLKRKFNKQLIDNFFIRKIFDKIIEYASEKVSAFGKDRYSDVLINSDNESFIVESNHNLYGKTNYYIIKKGSIDTIAFTSTLKKEEKRIIKNEALGMKLENIKFKKKRIFDRMFLATEYIKNAQIKSKPDEKSIKIVLEHLRELREKFGVRDYWNRDSLKEYLLSTLKRNHLEHIIPSKILIERFIEKLDKKITIPKVIEHGDLTPSNVLWTKNKPIILDWEWAVKKGEPLFDIYCYVSTSENPDRIITSEFFRKNLEKYDLTINDFKRYIPIGFSRRISLIYDRFGQIVETTEMLRRRERRLLYLVDKYGSS